MNKSFDLDAMSFGSGVRSDQLLKNIASRQAELGLESVELRVGEVLFEQGQPDDGMYLLISGKLGVRILQPNGTEQLINELTEGAPVGELALMTGHKRSATIFAIEAASLIRITKNDVHTLLENGDDLIGDISAVAVERWRAYGAINGTYSFKLPHDGRN